MRENGRVVKAKATSLAHLPAREAKNPHCSSCVRGVMTATPRVRGSFHNEATVWCGHLAAGC
eukprot:8842865-Lingulodinium_polyedra.AAC.1